jgi:hypothetical protein
MANPASHIKALRKAADIASAELNQIITVGSEMSKFAASYMQTAYGWDAAAAKEMQYEHYEFHRPETHGRRSQLCDICDAYVLDYGYDAFHEKYEALKAMDHEQKMAYCRANPDALVSLKYLLRQAKKKYDFITAVHREMRPWLEKYAAQYLCNDRDGVADPVRWADTVCHGYWQSEENCVLRGNYFYAFNMVDQHPDFVIGE